MIQSMVLHSFFFNTKFEDYCGVIIFRKLGAEALRENLSSQNLVQDFFGHVYILH